MWSSPRASRSGKLFSSGLLALVLIAAMVPAAAAVTAPWDPFFANQQTIADLASIGTNTRPFGIAVGDYNEDGDLDMIIGRSTGNIHFATGNGDGTFDPPTQLPWKLESLNSWALAATDWDGDGNLDLVWSATVAGADAGAVTQVNDGEVRVILGNGDGTFVPDDYLRSGVTFRKGTLIADIGEDAGSLAAGDIDGDTDPDLVVGGRNATNTVIRVIQNNGVAAPTITTLVNLSTTCTAPCSPIHQPAISTVTSPWGLALGDTDADGDLDLWVGDRALYVYLYENDAGVFTLSVPSNPPLATRPNAMLVHESFRAALGFTPALASDDINGDGKADLLLGLQSGSHNPEAVPPPAANAHDGEVLLDVSNGSGYVGFGPIVDIGFIARGVTATDLNEDGTIDVVAANQAGQVKYLRQLEPLDTDTDGISDYVDNAPENANAARIDMNRDSSINYRDQLDNDFDTVLGDPESPGSWTRLGDVIDPDDDNDGVTDMSDICPFVPDADQGDMDSDGIGNACDPLDDRDPDGDGVPTGPLDGDQGYADALAAAIKWSQGDTHFVIRIDALGRFFQNEFTQIMTDAATLDPTEWAAKCWENYQGNDVVVGGVNYEPCGTGEGTPGQTLTLTGGKDVPISLVTIPAQLWTDPPVIDWINDRNDDPNFELGQHGTYHFNNVPLSDWASMPDRDFFSCEPCGLTEAENYELMKVGFDTLMGNYDNRWVAESGATAGSPKIDWNTSAHDLLSYAPPFNASDLLGRKGTAQLGFKAFSASVFEENSSIFTPEGSHHEAFDDFGMFHASADLELDPPDTTGDDYNVATYENYLQSNTDDGGLTTWLIEEVEWSGRPCPNDDRLGTCSGASNRENNTVYQPRWDAWMQLLNFVNNYPNGVAMTMDEVALAKGFDNAPTVANAGQTDTNADGLGDVIEGATIVADDVTLPRNAAGNLSATLTNGAGDPIAGQTIVFSIDADGDATPEQHQATTGADGVATASVTPTVPEGTDLPYTASWDGLRTTAQDTSGLSHVITGTTLTLPDVNVSRNAPAIASATLVTTDDGDPVAGKTISFYALEKVKRVTAFVLFGTATTDTNGVATMAIPGKYISRNPVTIRAIFEGDAVYTGSQDDATVVRR